MTLILNNSFIAGNLGDTAIFNDITGTTAPYAYGKSGNPTIADVDGIRLKIAYLASQYNIQTLVAGNTFTQFTEYICTLGTGTIDNKGITVGSRFVPQLANLTVPNGMKFETTGYYVPQILATWLPTATQVALTLSLTQIGQAGSTLIADSTYTLEYEIYGDSFTGTQAAVNTKRYMVLSSTATYDGNTFRAGEVFTADDTSNIVASGNVVKLLDAKTTYATITYNLLKTIFEILPNASEETQKAIYAIMVQIRGLEFSCATGNVSYTYARGLLNRLSDEVIYLTNNN